MKKWDEAMVYITFFLGIFLLAILFGGEPDLMSAIIEYIKAKSH